MSLDGDLAFFQVGGTNAVGRLSDHLATLVCLCFRQTQAEDYQQGWWTCGEPVQRSPAVWSCTDETTSKDSSQQLVHISRDLLDRCDEVRT